MLHSLNSVPAALNFRPQLFNSIAKDPFSPPWSGVALAAEWTQPSIANSQRLIRKQYFDLMQSFCQAEDLSTVGA